MPTTHAVPVQDLKLDLSNFRTVPQSSELGAVHALISINPDWFWALMRSLLDSGYLPTENILLLISGSDRSELIVKEGNRRVAALKLVHGYLQIDDLGIPEDIKREISVVSEEWRSANALVPCAVYNPEEASVVDRIVTLTHGKGEKAGRDAWTAVARARHNRDVSRQSEPGLDLLEEYLRSGRNLTPQQRERWAGSFPLTVLDEALKRLAKRFGAISAPDLSRKYPSISNREALEEILLGIGLQTITFEKIRSKGEDFAAKYGVPTATPKNEFGGATSAGSDASQGSKDTGTGTNPYDSSTSEAPRGDSRVPQDPSVVTVEEKHSRKMAAVAVNDPRAVKRILRGFTPKGDRREKVVALRKEALELSLDKNPLAFCFLLRSMFEISAKAYCADHKKSGGPSATKSDGGDRRLVEILRDITTHLTKEKKDHAMAKELHGAMAELAKHEGILSVTSMNQLVHNPSFSVTAGDISAVFGNVFPLLAAMNR